MSFYAQLRMAITRFIVVLALLWERMVPLIFPALLFPTLYLALALFGVFEHYGDPLRLITLITSTVLTVYFFTKAARRFSWPDRQTRARRLEHDAHLSGRPLELLDDKPTQADNPKTKALWQAEQARAQKALLQLRPRKPRAALARRDAYGLRAAAFLLVFSGFVLAGPQAKGRLDEAFAPQFLSTNTSLAKIETWVTGPQYAGLAPKFLRGDSDTPIDILIGSTFHLKIRGARKRPSLFIRTNGKKHRLNMQKTGPQNYDLGVTINANSMITLKRPNARLWQVVAVADKPPKVLFTKTPQGDTSDALAFSYAARDDVGIDALALVLSLKGQPEQTDQTAIDLPARNVRALDEKTALDFTRHRWAGLPVNAALVAHDGAGQTATTQSIALTLPNKLFVNPMARAIAEQRSLIIRTDAPYAPMSERPVLDVEDVRARPPFTQDKPSDRLLRAPPSIQRSAAFMRASLRAPEMFFEDPLVYVGLRYAAENLRLARRPADFKDLDNELWVLALWAEGGALADARAALKAAERAFRRALARSAPADELARLMNNYERAVKRYMQALAEEALRRGQMADSGGGGADMDASGLQDMLDALKALSETGARGDARKLLQALSELLQNMQMQLASGTGSGSGDDPASEAMRKALEELGDITAEQREILDEMFRKQQGANKNGTPQAGQSGEGNPSGPGLAGEQKDLSGQLRALADDQTKEGRNGASGALREGADKMGSAAGALTKGDMDQALNAAKDALAALRDGSEALASDLFDHITEKNGNGQGEERDPFGRPTRGGGSQAGDGTSVPDVINAERAREILQLLRDRAAQAGRSDTELEYLDRLLERF